MSGRKEHRMTAKEKRRYNTNRSNNRKAKLTIPDIVTRRCSECLGWYQQPPKDKTPHQCSENRVYEMPA